MPLREAISTITSPPQGFFDENMKKKQQLAKKLFSYARIDPYENWKPQFPDGSGWNRTFKDFPYFYEHITNKEVYDLLVGRKRFQKSNEIDSGIVNSNIYMVISVMIDPDFGGIGGRLTGERYHNHKNTYFVKGSFLEHFLAGFIIDNYYDERVVSIQEVRAIPSFKTKLKQ